MEYIRKYDNRARYVQFYDDFLGHIISDEYESDYVGAHVVDDFMVDHNYLGHVRNYSDERDDIARNIYLDV